MWIDLRTSTEPLSLQQKANFRVFSPRFGDVCCHAVIARAGSNRGGRQSAVAGRRASRDPRPSPGRSDSWCPPPVGFQRVLLDHSPALCALLRRDAAESESRLPPECTPFFACFLGQPQLSSRLDSRCATCWMGSAINKTLCAVLLQRSNYNNTHSNSQCSR